MKAFVCKRERLLVALGVVLLLGYGFTGLSYELLFVPLYPLVAVLWIWGKLRERSDAARSTGSR